MTAIIGFVLKLVGFFIDSKVKDNEVKEKWFNFVIAMQDAGYMGAQGRESYKKQLEDLKKDVSI